MSAPVSNVRAIRPGIVIPEQREDDRGCIVAARIMAGAAQRARKVERTAPGSEEHRVMLAMAAMAQKLPRNNLRLIVAPLGPRKEWFTEAMARVRIAKAADDLAQSRWSLAYHLDLQDGGERRAGLSAERSETRAALDLAIEEALRTPTTRKYDAMRKQEIVGRREWAEKYRPDWQALVDEDLARYPIKTRKPRVAEAAHG